jgi:hypothetical protein
MIFNLKGSKMKQLNMGTGNGGGVPERPKKQPTQPVSSPAKKK